MLIKGKVLARLLTTPDPLKPNSRRTTRPELVRMVFKIKQIGPLNGILEPVKFSNKHSFTLMTPLISVPHPFYSF